MITAFVELQKNWMEVDTNLVQKILLIVTGDDAQAFIEFLLDNNGWGEGGIENQHTEAAADLGRVSMKIMSNMMETHELRYIK